MQISNLNFFDKFGQNLNLDWNADESIWTGIIYMPSLSTYLYDNENIFILEKVGTDYKFPELGPGTKLSFQWKDNSVEDQFFLYDVEKDYDLNNYFISKKDQVEVSYDDLMPASGGSTIDLNLPLQINVAFNPLEEVKYETCLVVYLIDETGPVTKVAEIGFYGEGINEDERLGVWARNFGIKFNKEDANILKDYDIKEAFPDWEQLNAARKSLLVNKENVYPYIGTYKGLSNFVNLLGYKDVLHIKEYWKNINSQSSYFDKQFLVDITDYLDDGKIDNINILDQNKNIKFGNQFKKTECLALVYEFTRATDNFDDDGIPEVEETTDFTVDEVFYKLNQLKRKLKSEFLPVNVRIKDIIGEFVYFQKITIKFWKDDTNVIDFDLNQESGVQLYPDKNVDLTIRSLNPLLRKEHSGGIDFGVTQLNVDNVSNPYENGQKYPAAHVQSMIDYIKSFYTEIKNQRYPDLGKRLTWEDGDDSERVIGAPIVVNILKDDFTVQTFKGITFEDLQAMGSFDPYYTLDNINFKNFYEITWKISKPGPNPYNWEFRGPIKDYYQLPHFLPYYGTYRVTAELHDFYGNTSVYNMFIEVQDDQVPHLTAITRLEDKFDYRLSNLENVRLIDFGSSPAYFPRVNVLDNESAITEVDIDKNITQWAWFHKNGYGMGRNMYDAELWDESTSTWVPYTDPLQDHPEKLQWGLGENREPVKIQDLTDVTIGSLYFMRMSDLIWTDDFKAGFYLRNPEPNKVIQISLFDPYFLPSFSSLEELVDILNESDHPGIKLFNYEIINGRQEEDQYIIHAQAEYLSKEMYHILLSEGAGSPASPTGFALNVSSPAGSLSDIDKYTFFVPREVYSDRLVNHLKSISPMFDEETLFLLAKTSDILNGTVQDPSFWVHNKYWTFEDNQQVGHLPTVIDQDAFNINDIKVFESSFDAPENSIVYFHINNIDGKKDFVWTLRHTGLDQEVIKVRAVPFFLWKFKDLGKYELTCEVTDNRGNIYTRKIDRHINVLNKKQYIKNIEKRLDRRKLDFLN